jgi:hypothetical protein
MYITLQMVRHLEKHWVMGKQREKLKYWPRDLHFPKHLVKHFPKQRVKPIQTLVPLG